MHNLPSHGYVDFSPSAGTSYHEHLRRHENRDSLIFGLHRDTAAIIGTNYLMFRQQMRSLEETGKATREGFLLVSQDLKSIETTLSESTDTLARSIDTLNHNIEWGFHSVLVRLGGIASSVEDLVRITSSPAMTWALEQFEVAQDEFERRLYPESLASLNRAINGFGSHVGSVSTCEFHFLLGTIRLGDFSNTSSDIVNLQLAETAFLAAARYATSKENSALALLCAGRAAFLEGRLTAAQKHLEAALSFDDGSAIRYQLARTYVLQGRVADSLVQLELAIRGDPSCLLKAAGEADWRGHQTEFNDCASRLRDEAASNYRKTLRDLEEAIRDVNSRTVSLPSIERQFPLGALAPAQFAALHALHRSVTVMGESATTFSSYSAANQIASQWSDFLARIWKVSTDVSLAILQRTRKLAESERFRIVPRDNEEPQWHQRLFQWQVDNFHEERERIFRQNEEHRRQTLDQIEKSICNDENRVKRLGLRSLSNSSPSVTSGDLASPSPVMSSSEYRVPDEDLAEAGWNAQGFYLGATYYADGKPKSIRLLSREFVSFSSTEVVTLFNYKPEMGWGKVQAGDLLCAVNVLAPISLPPRWINRSAALAGAGGLTAATNQRLDDELRDLD